MSERVRCKHYDRCHNHTPQKPLKGWGWQNTYDEKRIAYGMGLCSECHQLRLARLEMGLAWPVPTSEYRKGT